MAHETPNEPPAAPQWYYLQDGETCGPIAGAQLKRLIQSGQLGADPLVWRQGMPDWVHASQLRAARRKMAADPSPTAPATTGTAAAPGVQRPVVRRKAVEERAFQAPASRVRVVNRIVWVCIAGIGLLMIGVWIGSLLRREDVSRGSSPGVAQAEHSDPAGEGRGRDRAAASSPAGSATSGKTTGQRDLPASSPRKVIPNVFKEDDGADAPPLPPSRPIENTTGSRKTVSAAPTASDTAVQSGMDAARNFTEDPLAKSTPDGPTTLFQEISIHRTPSYGVSGFKVAQEVRYQILSRLELGQRLADGTRKVVQRVEDARLESAEEMSRETYERALLNLRGQQYIFTLNELDEIIDFSGFKSGTTTSPVTRPGEEGLLMVTVIDKDGWKELAQLSFLRPDKRIAAGQPWTRQMTHSFEPLGSLKGVTTFTQRGPEGANMRYDYTHAMTYVPPEKMEGVLPMGISRIDFRVEEAFGSFVFDPAQGHVTEVQETFRLTGTMGTAGSDLLGDVAGAELLGSVAGIQLEERQEYVIRLTRQNPWAAAVTR